MKDLRIGFDVGGTFTDGVVVKGSDILVKTKTLTTEDVTTGIINALDKLLLSEKVNSDKIGMISLGTTHTTNAIIERKGLNKVGIFRLGLPGTTAIPPLTGWPENLQEAIGGKKNVYMIYGGSEYDGRDIAPLDEISIANACKKMKGQIDSVAITGIFSPTKPDHELRAAQIVSDELGENINISLSHRIASISILERENSTILNASVISCMRRAVKALRDAMHKKDIEAPLFIVQNDGSVMSADFAIDYPIFTVASGPAASVRGAVYLSGIEDGAVVDVGGTSTDVAYIVKGFPRESSITVNIGGVKTNIRCPDLMSIALGGGTIVKTRGQNVYALGPESVGYNLVRMGKSYGGPLLTVHDVAVAAGILTSKLEIFDTDYVTHLTKLNSVPKETINQARLLINSTVATAIDQMKTSAGKVPAIFVGGGAMLIPTDLEGVTEVITPEHFEVGGAIGTTISEIGAYAEGVVDLEKENRNEAISLITEKAKDNAHNAGADRNLVQIVDIEEIPFTYMPGKCEKIRIRVKGKALI